MAVVHIMSPRGDLQPAKADIQCEEHLGQLRTRSVSQFGGVGTGVMSNGLNSRAANNEVYSS
jgi:hypothetical protein